MLRFIVMLLVSAAFMGSIQIASSQEDLVQEWFRTLMQPDRPTVSCCGFGDAYIADEQEFDANGNLIAIITDTRPDELKLPDGRTLYRPHREPGTRILIPKNKIRKPATYNPTGHTIVFVAYDGVTVYCYEPQPLI